MVSRKLQAGIVESCVETALLFESGAKVWYRSEFQRLQKLMVKCYRYSLVQFSWDSG